MFSQDPLQQKIQMEELAADLDALISLSQSHTYRSTEHPSQIALEDWWTGLGNTLPIPPQQEIFWHDTYQLRSLHTTMKDYFVPVLAQPAYNPTSNYNQVRTQMVQPIDRTRFLYVGTIGEYQALDSIITEIDRTALMSLDTSSEILIESDGATHLDVLNREVLYAKFVSGSTYNLHRVNIDTGVDTDTGYDIGPANITFAENTRVWEQKPDRSLLWVHATVVGTTPTYSLRQRTLAGTVTTLIADLGALGVTGLVRHLKYDATSDKILIFYSSNATANSNTACVRVDSNGANPTVLIPMGAFAAGFVVFPSHVATGFTTGLNYPYWMGAEVREGILYTPQTGLDYLNVNTRRMHDIATGDYLGTETFDFGAAYANLKDIVAEATALRELDKKDTSDVLLSAQNTGNHRTQVSRFYGIDTFSGLFTKLIDIQRMPDDSGWLLRYWNTWGPGPNKTGDHTYGNYWSTGFLPDDEVSGKIYAITEYGDGRGDYTILNSATTDAAVKEVVLELPDINMDDFGTLVISFDSGLSGTDTISVQINGLTANYTQHQWRLVATTNTYTTATGSAWTFPGVAQGATTGGRYTLTFVNQDKGLALAGMVEGFLTSGITTGLTSSVIGSLSNTTTDPITTVRIFTTGAVQTFSAGSNFEIAAYRTKARNRRKGEFYYGPYLV